MNDFDLLMSRFIYKSLVAVMLVFIVSVSAAGQLSSKEIDHLVEDAMEKFTVAGVAVGIVKDGKIIHARGYGVKSVETNAPVDEHTAFAIASNSKAFTTTALSLLVEEGKLLWTDRVIDHIPEFKMYNDYVTQNFNIQDLVTHRSGLGLGAGDLQKWPSGSDFTIADILSSFQHFEPTSAFRTKYDYDNMLYLVAGEVIKRITGIRWEDFVMAKIMRPLGMDHSNTLPPGMVHTENLAVPHVPLDGALRTVPPYEIDPDKISGAAGNVLSSSEDMCRWILVHLNAGRYGKNLEKQLFSLESQTEMWKIHTVKDSKPYSRYTTHFSGYGLGWHLCDLNGNFCVYHTGDYTGMYSKTMMFPDLDLGMVVLTNSYYGGDELREAVTLTIVDSYLGLDDFGWTDKYLERYKNQSGEAKKVVDQVWLTVADADDAHIDPGDFLGIYEDKWFGKIKIYKEGDQLWFTSMRSPKLTGPMYFYKANAFAIRWEVKEMDADAFVIFSLDEEGVVQTITMKGISPDIDFSYDFQDLYFERTQVD
jgi:CubicO group peptidase (beta-lactamase class C family)